MYHLSSVVVLCGVMVISTVIVLILYNKSDQKHRMSPRVQKVFSFLGELLCHKTQSMNEIFPANIEVKETQSDDTHNEREQGPKPRKANKDFNKEERCCCWKDAARILDKTFFVLYSSTVFILTTTLFAVMRGQGYPTRHCT